MLLGIPKVSSIEDTTQKELREIETAGALSAGEKSLADLRKRKLAVQKSGSFRFITPLVDLDAGKANGSQSTRGRILVPQLQSQRRISLWIC